MTRGVHAQRTALLSANLQKKMAQILQLMGSEAKETEEQYQSMNEALKLSSIK